MNTEQTTIVIKRFRSPDGIPTCCANHTLGTVCRFFGSRKVGTSDVCMLGERRDLMNRTNGFIRPDNKCEVWKDQV